MSISASAEVEVQKMVTLLDAIKQGMQEGLLAAGNHIVDLASQLAPEETGALKGSGRVKPVEDGVDVSFGSELDDARAIAQEYGTVYTPAQPYLGPAVAAINIVEEVAKAVRRRMV